MYNNYKLTLIVLNINLSLYSTDIPEPISTNYADIAIMLDSSSGVRQHNFKKYMLQFAKAIADELDIGPTEDQVPK